MEKHCADATGVLEPGTEIEKLGSNSIVLATADALYGIRIANILEITSGIG